MDEKESYHKLTSKNESEIWDALGELIEQSNNGIPLSDRVRSALEQLLCFESNVTDSEAKAVWEEETRREAATLLGLYFHEPQALPSLIKFLGEKGNTDEARGGAILSISTIGRSLKTLKEKCIECLVNFVSDTSLSQEIRTRAYVELMELADRFSARKDNTEASLQGTQLAIDMKWVKSLAKS